MKWSIHHVNLETKNVEETATFYRDVLGMTSRDWVFPATRGYLPSNPDKLALFADDRQSHTGLHLIAPDDTFADKNGMDHNPSIGGHVAIEVDDLNAVIARLERSKTGFSLTGEFAIPGMRHLYVEDPAGNLLEINERLSGTIALAGVRYLVLCKVTEDQAEHWQDIMVRLDKLRERLVMGPMSWGKNTSSEGLDRGYSHVFSVDFPTVAARDAYLNDPAHKALGARLCKICMGGKDGLCVVDF